MSTTSTVPALAEPDPTLGNDNETANWNCMLVATCTDGTLLCPTSFHQEDAVVMSEGLGQEHPKGVLWLIEMEMILVFQSNSEMMATIHWLAVAIVWHSDPTVLCIWPLSTKQVNPALMMGSGGPLPWISRNLIMTSCGNHWRPLDLRQLGGKLASPPHRSSQANMWVPGGGSKASMACEGVGLEGGGNGKLSSSYSSLPVLHRQV